MATFIDFVTKEINNQAMGNEFVKQLEAGDAGKLADWFKGQGYEVSKDDCGKMIDNKDGLIKLISNENLKRY